jgi:hypothetical protein
VIFAILPVLFIKAGIPLALARAESLGLVPCPTLNPKHNLRRSMRDTLISATSLSVAPDFTILHPGGR